MRTSIQVEASVLSPARREREAGGSAERLALPGASRSALVLLDGDLVALRSQDGRVEVVDDRSPRTLVDASRVRFRWPTGSAPVHLPRAGAFLSGGGR